MDASKVWDRYRIAEYLDIDPENVRKAMSRNEIQRVEGWDADAILAVWPSPGRRRPRRGWVAGNPIAVPEREAV